METEFDRLKHEQTAQHNFEIDNEFKRLKDMENMVSNTLKYQINVTKDNMHVTSSLELHDNEEMLSALKLLRDEYKSYNGFRMTIIYYYEQPEQKDDFREISITHDMGIEEIMDRVQENGYPTYYEQEKFAEGGYLPGDVHYIGKWKVFGKMKNPYAEKDKADWFSVGNGDLAEALELNGFVAKAVPELNGLTDEYYVIYKIDDSSYGWAYVRESELDTVIADAGWNGMSFAQKVHNLITHFGYHVIIGNQLFIKDKDWAYTTIGIKKGQSIEKKKLIKEAKVVKTLSEHVIGDSVWCGGDSSFCDNSTDKIENIIVQYDNNNGEPYNVIILSGNRRFDSRNGQALTPPMAYYITPLSANTFEQGGKVNGSGIDIALGLKRWDVLTQAERISLLDGFYITDKSCFNKDSKDLSESQRKDIATELQMTVYEHYDERFEQGGKISDKLRSGIDKAKHIAKKGASKVKGGYETVKTSVKDSVHDQKKKVALGVLSDMGMMADVTKKEEEMIVNPAYNLIYERYENGGEIPTADISVTITEGDKIETFRLNNPQLKKRILEADERVRNGELDMMVSGDVFEDANTTFNYYSRKEFRKTPREAKPQITVTKVRAMEKGGKLESEKRTLYVKPTTNQEVMENWNISSKYSLPHKPLFVKCNKEGDVNNWGTALIYTNLELKELTEKGRDVVVLFEEGGNIDDYTKRLGKVDVIFENPKYNYSTNVSAETTEESARQYFVGKTFNVGACLSKQIEKVIDIKFYPKGTYEFEEGGEITEIGEGDKQINAYKDMIFLQTKYQSSEIIEPTTKQIATDLGITDEGEKVHLSQEDLTDD